MIGRIEESRLAIAKLETELKGFELGLAEAKQNLEIIKRIEPTYEERKLDRHFATDIWYKRNREAKEQVEVYQTAVNKTRLYLSQSQKTLQDLQHAIKDKEATEAKEEAKVEAVANKLAEVLERKGLVHEQSN